MCVCMFLVLGTRILDPGGVLVQSGSRSRSRSEVFVAAKQRSCKLLTLGVGMNSVGVKMDAYTFRAEIAISDQYLALSRKRYDLWP